FTNRCSVVSSDRTQQNKCPRPSSSEGAEQRRHLLMADANSTSPGTAGGTRTTASRRATTTRKTNATRRSTTAKKAATTRARGRAASARGRARTSATRRTTAAASSAESATRTPVEVISEGVERAVLIPVGAALIARDRVVTGVNDVLTTYSTPAKAQTQLRKF